MASWNFIPREIQHMVLDALILLCKEDAQRSEQSSRRKPRLAKYASVCRFWQEVMEPETFGDLYIKVNQLANFDNYMRGDRRRMLRHLWYRVKLAKGRRRWDEQDKIAEEEDNNALFTTAVYDLFAVLRKWNRAPAGKLPQFELELGAESSSDPKWRFGDEGIRNNSDYCVGELDFCFVDGFKKFTFPSPLPEVSVVSTFSILRRTRRYFAPQALLTIFDSLPNLREVRYEPWYFLSADSQADVDEAFGRYIKHWPHTVKRISIYEHCKDFRRHFPSQITEFDDVWMDENGWLSDDLHDHEFGNHLHHHHHHHHHHHDLYHHAYHHHSHGGEGAEGEHWHGMDNESVDEDGWETANEEDENVSGHDDDGDDDDDDDDNDDNNNNSNNNNHHHHNHHHHGGGGGSNNAWSLPTAPELVQAFANVLTSLPIAGMPNPQNTLPPGSAQANGQPGDPGGAPGADADYVELAPLGLGLLFIRPSQKLQELAVSGLIDARDFFEPFYARPEAGMGDPLPYWDELRWLTLTSPILLNPSPADGGVDTVNELLQAAGRAAMRMPKLRVMELYCTDARGGAVFRYEAAETRSAISWSSAWSKTWTPPDPHGTISNNNNNNMTNGGGNNGAANEPGNTVDGIIMAPDDDGDVEMRTEDGAVEDGGGGGDEDEDHPKHFRVGQRVIETWQRVARRHTRHDLDPVFETILTWPGNPLRFIHDNLITRELVLHKVSSMDILQTRQLPRASLQLPPLGGE